MTTIALLIAPKQLLGFLLLAGDDEASAVREGIFTGVPADASLLEHELSRFIQQYKNTEASCLLDDVDGHLRIRVDVAAELVVVLNVPAVGLGAWHVEQSRRASVSGVCERVGAKD